MSSRLRCRRTTHMAATPAARRVLLRADRRVRLKGPTPQTPHRHLSGIPCSHSRTTRRVEFDSPPYLDACPSDPRAVVDVMPPSPGADGVPAGALHEGLGGGHVEGTGEQEALPGVAVLESELGELVLLLDALGKCLDR